MDKILLNEKPIANADYKLVHWDKNSEALNFAIVEEQYKAKYIGEFTVKAVGGGWVNMPCSLFYTEKAHPEGSNYFALVYKYDPFTEKSNWVITDGISAAENTWNGILNPKTGQILYSAYRHDYQTLDSYMADGGADYMRFSGDPGNVVSFKIVDGEIVLLKDEENGEAEKSLNH